MKELLVHIVFFLSYYNVASGTYDITCSNIDYIYSNSNCCNENNVAKCVKKMPHTDYSADVLLLEEKLQNIGLCEPEDPKCIMDFPNISTLTAKMNTLLDGDPELVIELAQKAQPKSPILTQLSAGFIVDNMTVPSNSTLTIADSLGGQGTIIVESLSAETAEIDVLKASTIVGNVDFQGNSLTDVNLDTTNLRIGGHLLLANARELNSLVGIDPGLKAEDISKIKGLDIVDASDLNVLKNISKKLTSKELNQLVDLDINPGDLNFLKGIDQRLGKEELDLLVGLDVDSATLNLLKGLTTTAQELNAFSGLTTTTDELNVLTNVSTQLTSKELNQLVGLDILPGDLNVLKGVDPALSHEELSLLVGLTASAASLNTLTNVSQELGHEELDLLVGLKANAQEINTLEGVNLALGKNEWNRLVNLDVNPGDLNVLKNVDPRLGKEELNLLVGLQAKANEINVLKDVNTALSAIELNKLVGLTAESQYLNILKDVNTDLDKQELNLLVGLDVDSVDDLNILKGVRHDIGKDELNNLVGLEVDATVINRLAFGPNEQLETAVTGAEFALIDNIAKLGETEPLKAVTTDSAGNVVFKGNVEIDGDLDIPHGKLKLNGVAISADITAQVINDAATHFNALTATVQEINQALDGITADATDLNKLHLMTATTEEMNRLDIAEAGKTQPNKVVTADSDGNVDFQNKVTFQGVVDMAELHIDSVKVESTATELNVLHGIESTLSTAEINYLDLPALTSVGTTFPSKVVTTDANNKVTFKGDVTLDDELHLTKEKLHIDSNPVLTSASELNTLVGVAATLTSAELNRLDGILSTTDDLNSLAEVAAAGVTPQDLFLLAGISTTSENKLANKVLVTDASGVVQMPQLNVQRLNVPVSGLRIDDTAVTASAENLNSLTGVSQSLKVSEINTLVGLTSDSSELNILDGALVTVTDINMLQGLGSSSANDVANRAIVSDSDKKVTLETLKVTNEVEIGKNKLKIDDVIVEASAVDLNKLVGLTSTVSELDLLRNLQASMQELNILHGALVNTNDINTLIGVGSSSANDVGNRVIVSDSDKKVTLQKLEVLGNLDIVKDKLVIDDVTVEASATDLNKLVNLTSTIAELDLLRNLQASMQELNILKGALINVDDLNMLRGVGSSSANDVGNRVIVSDSEKKVTLEKLEVLGNLDILKDKLVIDNVTVEASAADLNKVINLTSTVAELNLLRDLKASVQELNTLHNMTSSTDDLNLLASLFLDRTNAAPNKAVVLDTAGNFQIPNTIKSQKTDIKALYLFDNSTQTYEKVVASAKEINALVGLKASNVELQKLQNLQSSPDELNILNGSIISTDDINRLLNVSVDQSNSQPNRVLVLDEKGDLSVPGDASFANLDVTGVFKINGEPMTLTAESINAFSGLKAPAESLNKLEFVDATAEEINKMLTNSSIEDLNLLAGVSNDRSNSMPNKAVVLQDDGNLTLTHNLEVHEGIFQKLYIGGEELVVSKDLQKLNGLNSTTEELNKLAGMTSSPEELNILTGALLSTEDLNLLQGLFSSDRTNADADRAVVLKDDGSLELTNDLRVDGVLHVDDIYLAGTKLNVSALELNVLNGIQADVNELNTMKGIIASTDELNILHQIQATTADLNLLQGLETDRSNSAANKVVVLAEDGTLSLPNNVTIASADLAKITVNGVELQASASEINVLFGADDDLTSTDLNRISNLIIGTTSPGKIVTTDEDNSVTFMGDVNVTGTLEASTIVLNGETLTATTATINALEELTVTAQQLEALKVTTLGVTEASKAVTTNENNTVEHGGELTVESLEANTIQVGSTIIEESKVQSHLNNLTRLTTEKIQEFTAITATADEINRFAAIDDDLDASDLNKLKDLTIDEADINALNVLSNVNVGALQGLGNIIALDHDNNANIGDLTVSGSFSVGGESLESVVASQCTNFFITGASCNGQSMHVLFVDSDAGGLIVEGVYFCKASGEAIKISE